MQVTGQTEHMLGVSQLMGYHLSGGLRDQHLAYKISIPRMSSFVREMDDQYGAQHVRIGSRTELTIAARLNAA